ncbi:carbon-nitrogen hydrolase family protein [Ramlibacter monticola]|uniref:Carbon-nitrogen hydrolase family protein n=1 Tax=Ramlibacter monticola TaxID=1926872 RepID=A0A937CQ02_9BURK|nr:carbon-nitrogen hydrolase family protein [Ramlibacter monticola]MBL0390060.1 carbon-nitrogen hydrolase family protein [Ramlibacter monticola]
MRVSLVQNNPQEDLGKSLNTVRELVQRAVDAGTDLVVLPEYYAFMGSDPVRHRDSGRYFGEIDQMMAALARETATTIHAGSLVEADGDKAFNTTVVYGADGSRIARYRKIHLFDIVLPNGTAYRESDVVAPGSEVVTYKVGDWTIGCSICYDLRFPELFRALRDRGADLLIVPAAFTLATGKDHWEVLLRARAIETGCYVAAPGQIFSFANGTRSNYGHSLVADPWGHVVAKASDTVGIVTATLDKAYLSQVRAQVPTHQHHRLS